MKMISISKLRVIQAHLEGYRNYFTALDEILKNSAASAVGANHPFLRYTRKEAKILLCVISSDTGLCGTYNNDVLAAVRVFVRERKDAVVTFVPVGKKAVDFVAKNALPSLRSYSGINGRYSDIQADTVAAELIQSFLTGGYDSVYCVYTKFLGSASQKPVVDKLLTIDAGTAVKEKFSFEPDADEVLNRIVPVYINAKMRYCLMNAFACEHSARGVAMGEATDNAKELLDNLILMRNKVRQAGITRDIIEVISSSEALKG